MAFDAEEAGRLRRAFGNVAGINKFPEYDPKDTEYYGETAIGSTASVIPGYYGDEDLGERGNLGPAPLTERPTSSTNASRPRTVAAGYQPYVGTRRQEYGDQRGKLTVMFRDGTVYNYYEVSPSEWQKFKGQLSKGPMLNWKPVPGFLLSKPHGPADMAQASEAAAQTIFRYSREAQIRFQYRGTQPTLQGSITPTAAKRAGLSPNRAKYGKNNATANKPHKPHKP